MKPTTKEPVSPGHAANDRARGVAPENRPTVLGKGDHKRSEAEGPFVEARHGVRKAGADNPKNR